MKIGNVEVGKFFLAPMEAVNCASFRVLCKRRSADLVFTDMIDADVFIEFVKETSEEEAIKKFVNPQKEEKPLAIQLGGANIETLKETIKILEPHANLFDYNLGCPLGYMLGKKGGVYLMKHPNILYKFTPELRNATKLPFTIKMRSGWDKENINALDICLELEKQGFDAFTIHGRTRKQRYQEKADWKLVKEIKEKVSVPIILSGDVISSFDTDKAFKLTNCDAIMIGRGAKNNPSVFKELKEFEKSGKIVKPTRTYNKSSEQAKQDFFEWLELYNSIEQRHKLSEIKDHALWTARDCKKNKEITQKIMNAENEEEIKKVFESIEF